MNLSLKNVPGYKKAPADEMAITEYDRLCVNRIDEGIDPVQQSGFDTYAPAPAHPASIKGY